MPYKSKAQEAWAHTAAGVKALGGEDKVNEWDQASKGKDLPKKVHDNQRGKLHSAEHMGKHMTHLHE